MLSKYLDLATAQTLDAELIEIFERADADPTGAADDLETAFTSHYVINLWFEAYLEYMDESGERGFSNLAGDATTPSDLELYVCPIEGCGHSWLRQSPNQKIPNCPNHPDSPLVPYAPPQP